MGSTVPRPDRATVLDVPTRRDLTAALLLLALATAAQGCGEPTREAQVDRHLRYALDHLALHRWETASVEIDRALHLEPGSQEAQRFRELLLEARASSATRPPAPQLEREAFVGGLDLSAGDFGRWSSHRRRDQTELVLPHALTARFDPRLARAQPGEEAWVTEARRVIASRTVTLDLPDVPLGDVASFLMDITGCNFVVPRWLEEVRVSLRLRNVPLVDALAIIAETTGTQLVIGPDESITLG